MQKSIENMFKKLEIWIDDNREIIHAFIPYVETFGCYSKK
jgi:hypothetical protein